MPEKWVKEEKHFSVHRTKLTSTTFPRPRYHVWKEDRRDRARVSLKGCKFLAILSLNHLHTYLFFLLFNHQQSKAAPTKDFFIAKFNEHCSILISFDLSMKYLLSETHSLLPSMTPHFSGLPPTSLDFSFSILLENFSPSNHSKYWEPLRVWAWTLLSSHAAFQPQLISFGSLLAITNYMLRTPSFISSDHTFSVSFISYIHNFWETSFSYFLTGISNFTHAKLNYWYSPASQIVPVPLFTYFGKWHYQAALVVCLRIISDFFFLYPVHTLSLSTVDRTTKVSLKSM